MPPLNRRALMSGNKFITVSTATSSTDRVTASARMRRCSLRSTSRRRAAENGVPAASISAMPRRPALSPPPSPAHPQG
jgi:hypothetical protein